MGRKSLCVVGILLVSFFLQSCQKKPEQGLLNRYFHAVTLNDLATLSKMALEPISIDAENWTITSVSEERIEPAMLPDMTKNEAELQKKLEAHVAPTLDAKDALDVAKDELDSARTRAARAAAQKKVDELQVKYDEEYELHKQLQKDFNDAKTASTREEEITNFSLDIGDLPNIRELVGDVYSKEVEVEVKTKAGETKNYKCYLRQYILRDEVLNRNYRGRWVIIKFEPIS